MKARGLSAAELSRKTEIPKRTISEWLGSAGRIPSKPEYYRKLSTALECSVEKLLFGKDSTPGLEALLAKTEIHTGLYELTIRKVNKK